MVLQYKFKKKVIEHLLVANTGNGGGAFSSYDVNGAAGIVIIQYNK
jgi:hypothetical protein